MAIEVFNRYEKKYLITRQQYDSIIAAMKNHMVLDRYNENGESYKICNIYYDTWDDRLISASIEKPVYKEKLRVRSYGVPGLNESVFVEIKKKYNDLVLSMEDSVRNRIEASEDPLAKALLYARVGNYIDFGAMNHVDEETFLSLLDRVEWNDKDLDVIQSFVDQCKRARIFLLIADNCGEIVLDKLFLEQLHKRFPELVIDVLVRGGEVLNDATEEDAEYVGINELARIISNGLPIAGTVYDMLPNSAKEVVNQADVILAKGQGNYESLSKQGRHIFFSFLCKCELFTSRFGVPKLTGIFVEEWD